MLSSYTNSLNNSNFTKTDRKHHEMETLPNTTLEKQEMGYGDGLSVSLSRSYIGVVHTEEEDTVGEGSTMEGGEEILADDTQNDNSTLSTEGSHVKRVFGVDHSSTLEADTDPTSIPSGFFDDLDLDRKGRESLEAVHGSDSVHSEESITSTAYSDSREDVPVAVKVKAIGDHFGGSGTDTPAARFHDPENSWEAQHINDKIKQANATMDDIDLHPGEHFRDHGSSFQVSARRKETAESALDAEGDIAHKRQVHFPPHDLLHFEEEEACDIRRRRRGKSPCCVIM